MKRLAIVLGIVAIAGAQAYAAGGYPAIVSKNLWATNDLRGKSAPKLEVQEWLTGAAPETDKKVVLIDFWATWCGPCRALIPELNEYQKKFGSDLVVIGISDEPPETVREFMKTHKMEYNVAVDPNTKMKEKVGVKGIPHVLVISPDNVVRWQGFPSLSKDRLTEEKLAQIINASKTP